MATGPTHQEPPRPQLSPIRGASLCACPPGPRGGPFRVACVWFGLARARLPPPPKPPLAPGRPAPAAALSPRLVTARGSLPTPPPPPPVPGPCGVKARLALGGAPPPPHHPCPVT